MAYTRFLSIIEKPIGIELYTAAMQQGLDSLKEKEPVITFEENLRVRELIKGWIWGRESADAEACIAIVEKVSIVLTRIFGEIKTEIQGFPSWSRCIYLNAELGKFKINLQRVSRIFRNTVDRDHAPASVLTSLESLETTFSSLEDQVERRSEILFRDESEHERCNQLPVVPEWKFEGFLEIDAFMHHLENQTIYPGEYCKTGSYLKTDVVVLRNQRWVKVKGVPLADIFIEWRSHQVLIVAGEGKRDGLHLFSRTHPKKVKLASAEQAARIGLACVQALRAFEQIKHEMKHPKLSVLILTRPSASAPDEYIRRSFSADPEVAKERVQAWLHSLLYQEGSTHQTALFQMLSSSESLEKLEKDFTDWFSHGNRSERFKEEMLFYGQMRVDGLEDILPFIQENLRKALGELKEGTLRQELFIEAHAKVVSLLRGLVNLPDKEKKGIAIQRVLSIHAKVMFFLRAYEGTMDFTSISAHHSRLEKMAAVYEGWGDVRVPSLVDVAFIYFQVQEQKKDEEVPWFFPMEKRGDDYSFHMGRRKGRGQDVFATYHWNKEEFYCEKRRSAICIKREETWFPLLTSASKKIMVYTAANGEQIIATELIPGINLRDYLVGRTLSEKEKLDIILQVAACVKEVHDQEGVFGDLTAGQFVRGPDGRLRLIDGESIIGKHRDTDRQEPIVTYALASPELMTVSPDTPISREQFEKSRHLTKRSDVWMLGFLIYQVCVNPPIFPLHTERYNNFLKDLEGDGWVDLSDSSDSKVTIEWTALLNYSKDLLQLAKDRKICPPLPETRYWIFSQSFAQFINSLMELTVNPSPTSRLSIDSIIGRIRDYQTAANPELASLT